MAIQDRNLSVGTQLYAKYKGQTHTAALFEKDGAKLYRLEDGREFKSLAAAGTGITGLACNGWAVWTVGEPPIEAEPEQPKTKTAKTPNAPRAKKAKAKTSDAPAEPPEVPVGTHANGKLACEVCGAEFDDEGAVTAHYMEQHAS